MKKYTVEASETVFYEVEVEAENEGQAETIVREMDLETLQKYQSADGETFQIDTIKDLNQ